MTSRRPHHPAHAARTALASAAMLLCGALPASQALAASCTWIPATGNWSVAGNWTCAPTIPSGPAGDSATIGSGKIVTVNDGRSIFNLTNAGTINIDAATFTLQGGGTVNNTGGAINVANGVVLNQLGVPITGGVLTTTGTGKIVASASNANFFSGLTLNGTLDMTTGTGVERVSGGLTLNGAVNLNLNSVLAFDGTQTLGGSGTIVLGDTGSSNRALSMVGDTTLTIGPNIVVRGQNGTLGQGYLASGTQSIVNNGRISADVAGGTFNLIPTHGVTNNGVLEAQNGGMLVLGANVTGGAGGSIVAGAGSTVLQNGVTLSGTINTSGSGDFRAANSNANLFSGVVLNGTLDLANGTGVERVSGGLTLNGTINLNLNSVLSFAGTQTLGGSGTIVLGDTGSSNRALSMEGDTTLTIGSGVTVRGKHGTLGQGYLASGTQVLVNNGRISADVAGGTFTLTPSHGTVNNGILEAQNGGTLVLNSNVAGSATGSIVAGAGSTVLQNGVTLSGIINASGTGSFRAAASNANFLDGVTFNGPLDLASGTGIERVVNGLTLNGAVNLNLNSVLAFDGTQTLGGNGTIVLGDTGSSNRALSMVGDTTLTIGPNIVVRGQNGTLGQGYLASGTQVLVNNGRISADVAGGTFTLAPSNGTTNNGVLEAQNGGTLILGSNVTGSPTGSIVAGAGSTVLQNGVTLSGIINASGTGNFRAAASNANFLDGVTFNGPLDLASGTSIERVVNGLTLNGAINLNLNSVLSFNGTQTLGGSGTIVLGDTGSSNRALGMEGDMTLTVGSGVTVRGKNGTVGQGYLASGAQVLANNGVIRADVSGGLIELSAGTTNNANILGAANGGVLRLNSTVNQTGAGRIDAADASAVIQNGVTVSGGLISTSGSGVFAPVNSNGNFLSGVTVSGLVDMSVTGVERVVNGLTLSGGSVKVNGNSVLSFSGDQTLGGTGEIVLGNTGSSNRALSLEGSTTLTIGSGVVVHGINGTLGQSYLSSGAQSLVNNGTINADGGGLISVVPATALVNNGTMRAQSGTLSIGQALTGTGTLQVDSAGVMNLANAANTQGKLLMGTAGATLILGTQNLTITNDYTNDAAGSGNAFNRRAGVSGAGKIMAGGDVAQVISGSGVTNGATTNATLTIGAVRVGATTFNYQVGNAGTTGPTLRGAIQTSVNGGNITDARLSGAGVTAANYNAGAPGGSSGALGVTFTAASAGLLAPMSGQAINLRSNFENIADQKLNIVLGAGAAAYNAAVGSAASPVTVANQRVGGSNSTALAVTNTAAAGAFSEDLNVTLGGSSGAATGSGSIAGRLAGASSGGGAITVGVNTSSAGAKTGSVTLSYQTAGTVNGVSNGLGTASVGSQAVAVSGNVYQLASGSVQTPTFNFGTLQVGQTITRDLTVRNTATGAAGFVEDLNASFGAVSGTGSSQISGSGALNGIRAGTDSTAANGTMTVQVTATTVGAITGGIGVNYHSAGAVNGASNGLGTFAVGGETYGVNGTIEATGTAINQALPVLNTPSIDLGAVRVGATAPSAFVSITNQATVAPQAALNASIASGGAPITASGSFSLLDPGATNNSALKVGLATGTAGNFSGTATIALVSDASNVGGCAPDCAVTLADQTVNVKGKVYTAATGALLTPTLDFGIVRVGDTVSARDITIRNTAAATALNDTLRGTLGGVAGPFTGGGSASGIVAQTNGAIAVGLNTSAAGVYSQTGSVGFLSQNPDMADISAGAAAAVLVKAQVNNLANADFDLLPGLLGGLLTQSGSDYVLDLGNIVIGHGGHWTLQLDNDVAGPADSLKGLFDLGGADDFSLGGFDPVTGLAAGEATGALNVDFAAASLGTFEDTVVFNGVSFNGSGPDIAQGRRLLIRAHVIDDTGTPAVPEPGTLALLLMAAAAGLVAKRRRAAATTTTLH